MLSHKPQRTSSNVACWSLPAHGLCLVAAAGSCFHQTSCSKVTKHHLPGRQEVKKGGRLASRARYLSLEPLEKKPVLPSAPKMCPFVFLLSSSSLCAHWQTVMLFIFHHLLSPNSHLLRYVHSFFLFLTSLQTPNLFQTDLNLYLRIVL